jgi:hypothetical protein
MNKSVAKEPYEPPRIRKVKLVAGELAVAHCKSVQVAPNVCKKGIGLFAKTIGS